MVLRPGSEAGSEIDSGANSGWAAWTKRELFFRTVSEASRVQFSHRGRITVFEPVAGDAAALDAWEIGV